MGCPAPKGPSVGGAGGHRRSGSAYHSVRAVAPERRGEAHIADREPRDPAAHHVARTPGPPTLRDTLCTEAVCAEPGTVGVDWPRGPEAWPRSRTWRTLPTWPDWSGQPSSGSHDSHVFRAKFPPRTGEAAPQADSFRFSTHLAPHRRPRRTLLRPD